MTLPSSGAISLSQVNTELGFGSTTQISLNDTSVRNLFGVGSGQISMSDGYGKQFVFTFSISSNQTDANLRTLAVNAGWNQTSPVQATINSGVVISGGSLIYPAALVVDGSWPNGVELVNNGTIMGIGGNGGNGGNGGFSGATNGSAGATGGRGLLVSSALTLNNIGTISGGGGGGGGGGADPFSSGSGGGGGRSSNINSSGGAGGTVGAVGNSGGAGTYANYGLGGAAVAGGGAGGRGGARGSSGVAGNSSMTSGGAGGGAGQAINGNSNITYISTGTRTGPIV